MLIMNPLVTDNAVFQAEKNHIVGGRTLPNQTIKLIADTLILEGRSNHKGEFSFILPPQDYGTSMRIRIIAEEESKEFSGQYGDVFLFAGQSNMQYTMAEEKHFLEERSSISDEKIFFHVVDTPEYELKIEEEAHGNWQKLTSDNLGELSAIAYYSMKEHKKNHPDRIIGIVVCSKGGTSASCWISEEDLTEEAVLNEEIMSPFSKAIEGRNKKSFDEEFKEYIQSYQQYSEKRAMWIREHPELTLGEIKQQIGHSPWPPPANPYLFNRPGGLYQTMFKRIAPFSFSAVIWYQGEEDTAKGPLYSVLLNRLIHRWRKDLMEQVPFYIIQLPLCQDKPQHDWATVRKAQAQAIQDLDNLFLITGLDCGEVDDIHPKEKALLGQRVGEIVDKVYYPSAPVAKIADWCEAGLSIEIEYANSLELQDHQIFELDTSIKKLTLEKNKIFIETTSSSHKISYAWENAPDVVLFNEVGYPVAPFRFERP